MLAIDRDRRLCERLNRHPLLRARVESLFEVVEKAAGDGDKADAAERRVIDERRQMGHEALTAWAERGVEKSVAGAQAEPAWRPGGKQNGMGTPPSGESRSPNCSGGRARALSGRSVPWPGGVAAAVRCCRG